MPWSDDTRCLYCDGKLPLFRKLTHGQFCTKVHQKKYWDEQQALVVERLHQTHNDIQAYKPPEPIESILGPLQPVPESDFSFLDADASSILGTPEPSFEQPVAASPAETSPAETLDALGVSDGPPIAGFLSTAIDPISGQITPFVATGSLEFEPSLSPETPAWAAPGAMGATVRLRAVAEYVWNWLYRPVNSPHPNTAWQSAIEFSARVLQPSHKLSVAVPNPAGEVIPALERQLDIAGPVPHAGPAAMQVADPTPLETPGQILHASHDLTAQHAALRSLHQQFSISGPEPRQAAAAPQGMVMAAAAGAVDFTFPALAVRPRGPAFEIESDYEPPLVEKLRNLSFSAQLPAQTAARAALQTGYINILAVRPETGLSKLPAVPAPADLPMGGLQELVQDAFALSTTRQQPIARRGVNSLELFVGETQRPVLDGISLSISGLAPGKLHALDLSPHPGHSVPNRDLQPAALATPSAAQFEPKLIGAPLVPNQLSLASLPWTLEVSGAPVWEPTPSRSLTPQVPAMLPSDSGSDVMAVTLAAEVEATPTDEIAVEDPIEIPAQAGHIAMPRVLTVSPADMQVKAAALARAVIPEPVLGQQLLPKLRIKLAKVEFTPPPIEVEAVPGAVIEAEAAKRGGLAAVRGFWKQAPRDLKLLACAIPILIGLAFHSLPKVSVTAPPTDGIQGGFRQALNAQFASIKQSVSNRAAIALDEDFRGGIDHWLSGTGATAEWSFNATGFVQPGPLALYEPSLKLTDYQMHFLGMIDEKALSWVVRADGFENYYVIKLVVLKPGPLPTIGLTRYAVIDGKPVDRVDRPVPINARADTIYRVRMDVHGSNFSVEVQGQMIDTWTESRLKRGGVGFFTGRGEKSSIRWVQLTHQYDTLGRLCAYLAPFEF